LTSCNINLILVLLLHGSPLFANPVNEGYMLYFTNCYRKCHLKEGNLTVFILTQKVKLQILICT